MPSIALDTDTIVVFVTVGIPFLALEECVNKVALTAGQALTVLLLLHTVVLSQLALP